MPAAAAPRAARRARGSAAPLAAAGSAVGFALTYILTKQLTARVGVACILWWMTVMQAVLGFLLAGLDGDVALPSGQTALWIALIGGAGLTAHFCIAKSKPLNSNTR